MRDAAMRIRLDPRYSVLTVAWLAAIYWLSSRTELGTSDSQPLVAFVSNLLHVPLFAGVTYCLLKSVSGEARIPSSVYAIVFAVATGYAALDEWHQSFVAGRFASVGDFLLDVTGIVAVILFLRFRAGRETDS